MPLTSNWRSELIALIKFAAPICIGQLAVMGMGVTDVIIAGNAGKHDLAGVMIGSNSWQIVAFFFFGIGMANAPIIGRYFGLKDWASIRSQLQQSLWLAIACGVLSVFLVLGATYLVSIWDIDAEAREIAVNYMLWVLPGAFCLATIPWFRSSLESMDEVHFVMKLNIACFFVNIIADYAFVFGFWGFPELGGAGCGLATSIVLMFQLSIYLWYLTHTKRLALLKPIRPFPLPNRKIIVSTLVLGAPIGFANLMEIGFFAGMGLRMADIGVDEAGAHAIALNIAAVVFMLFLSIGYAVTVKASQLLGNENYARARQTILLGLGLVVAIATVTSSSVFLLRHELPLLFNKDTGVVLLAANFLIYAALFQFADAIQVTVICGLRAYKDTAVPSFIQFVAFWLVGMPLGVFLPMIVVPGYIFGASGVWIAMCISLLVSASILLVRLRLKVFSRKG